MAGERCTGDCVTTLAASSSRRSRSGSVAEVAVADGEQIEGQDVGRRLGGQPVDAGGGRVDALLQGVEVEALGSGHGQFGVDHAALGQARLQRRDQLGEVPGEGALVAAVEHDLVAVAEHDATEPVPLRLVEPAVAERELVGGLGQHRGQRAA